MFNIKAVAQGSYVNCVEFQERERLVYILGLG